MPLGPVGHRTADRRRRRAAAPRGFAPPAFHRRLSPPRSQACVPFVLSAASAAALCARMRLRGRPGGRRSTPQLEQRSLGSRPLCFCPFLCPLANRRMRIRFGGHYLVHPRLYPQVRLDAAADFPFFRSKIGLRRPAVRLRSIVDPPEGRGCCCALQAAAMTFVIKPPYRCRRLFRRWRHSPPVFVKQALDPSPRLQPFSRGHRCRCS